MDKYDCTKDVTEHIFKVGLRIKEIKCLLESRADTHDASKLQEPEKSMFDEWTPKLKLFEFGSAEYKDALVKMGDALKHHYANNRHHPEHFDGICDMNLIDIVEMLCDWIVAAETKGNAIDLEYLADRFGIEDQLTLIIYHTLQMLDVNTKPVDILGEHP